MVLDSVWDFVLFLVLFFFVSLVSLVSLVLDLPWDFVFFGFGFFGFFDFFGVFFGFFGCCGFVRLFVLHICDGPKLETFFSFD